ncbi:DNA-directed RNA polymerase subunit sigma [Fervidicella metallireducens AeB]|uniref:DNA-directed RNA polymerase subunit sigma n=1 Tax=Fervidicella metallireducens AeB TaxID=1403537 RepID=A0A017RX98_9CLOT|nr:sigma-70 family RNA polymerase sigma factor [Fervidicella metallireducens]EYE89211.1 DNA-directed RNA polymerase subunit sigma [Fervidicella metallireducens AeB]
MEEMELIERCKNKDLLAFEKLFSIYENKIYNLSYYTLKNKEDARDVTQDVCLKIYKSIEKFQGNSKISTWIYRITYNTCIDYLKKKKAEISFEEASKFEIDNEYRVESIVEKNEIKNIIKKCILRLSNDHRTIIILRDINGLSYQEISEILGLEIGTVKSRINRAREALKNELTKTGIRRGC